MSCERKCNKGACEDARNVGVVVRIFLICRWKDNWQSHIQQLELQRSRIPRQRIPNWTFFLKRWLPCHRSLRRERYGGLISWTMDDICMMRIDTSNLSKMLNGIRGILIVEFHILYNVTIFAIARPEHSTQQHLRIVQFELHFDSLSSITVRKWAVSLSNENVNLDKFD